MTDLTVAALAAMVNGRLIGDGERCIRGLGDLRSAGPEQIGFVRHLSYAPAAAVTRAGALLVTEPLTTPASQIVVGDVDIAFAKVAGHFHPQPSARQHEVHPTAVVHPEAQLEAPVSVGPRAVVGRCRIGAGSVVMAGAVVGDDAVLGPGCVLYPNATLYHGVRLGARVIVHSNAVVGSDGFGYAHEGERWLKVPQLGTVEIGDDVELGANTAVDRATLGATRIGSGCKIDNLCHIAHNCEIGPNTVMAAGCLVAGSTKLGARCVVGGSVAVSGHLVIGPDVRIAGASAVLQDIAEPGDYMGYPLMDKRQWLRTLQVLRELPERRTRKRRGDAAAPAAEPEAADSKSEAQATEPPAVEPPAPQASRPKP
jgi:UDP-3-O-[3-hydroxymyristoyl] glucosamine N-acyltransferase